MNVRAVFIQIFTLPPFFSRFIVAILNNYVFDLELATTEAFQNSYFYIVVLLILMVYVNSIVMIFSEYINK